MRVIAPVTSRSARPHQFVRSDENSTTAVAFVQRSEMQSTSVKAQGRLKSKTATIGLSPGRPTVSHSTMLVLPPISREVVRLRLQNADVR